MSYLAFVVLFALGGGAFEWLHARYTRRHPDWLGEGNQKA